MKSLIKFSKGKNLFLGQLTPLRRCNLRCNHCFITNEHKAMHDFMDFGLFKKSLLFLYDSGIGSGASEIEIVLMGGELHMLPEDILSDYMDFAVKTQLSYMRKYHGKVYISTNTISNLIGINSRKLDIFISAFNPFKESEYFNGHHGEFAIVSSFEPDTGRFKSDKVFNQWVGNIKYLANADCHVGIAITGTKGTIQMGARKIHDLLFKGLGVQYLFDYYASFGEGTNSLMPEYNDLTKFLIDMFSIKHDDEEYFEDRYDGESINIPYVLENLHSRWILPISINFDGSISLDSESAADEQLNALKSNPLINVNDEDVVRDEQLYLQAHKRLIALGRDVLSPMCSSCRHVSYCQGGYIHYKNLFNNDNQCPGLYQIWDALFTIKEAS